MIIHKTTKTNLVRKRNESEKKGHPVILFAALLELNTNNNRVIHKVLLCFGLRLILTFPLILPF